MMAPTPLPRLRLVAAACCLIALLAASASPSSARGAPHSDELARSPDAEWSWPIGYPRIITRPFEAPATRYSAGHRGLDIEQPLGGTVFAPAHGTVSFAGWVAGRPVLSIKHDGGFVSSYEAVTTTLRAGDLVREGDSVATVSEGGHCAGACVHFGVRLHGEYVSPLLLLGGIPRAVLLPLG